MVIRGEGTGTKVQVEAASGTSATRVLHSPEVIREWQHAVVRHQRIAATVIVSEWGSGKRASSKERKGSKERLGERHGIQSRIVSEWWVSKQPTTPEMSALMTSPCDGFYRIPRLTRPNHFHFNLQDGGHLQPCHDRYMYWCTYMYYVWIVTCIVTCINVCIDLSIDTCVCNRAVYCTVSWYV
jgi:hypothetical protein